MKLDPWHDERRGSDTGMPGADRIIRLSIAAAVLAGLTGIAVAVVGLPEGVSEPGVEPAVADPFGEHVPPDSPERGQVGDCLRVYEDGSAVTGELVDCQDSQANYQIYSFATGTLDEGECPPDPAGKEVGFWYQLDFPDSEKDDYVVCALKL